MSSTYVLDILMDGNGPGNPGMIAALNAACPGLKAISEDVGMITAEKELPLPHAIVYLESIEGSQKDGVATLKSKTQDTYSFCGVIRQATPPGTGQASNKISRLKAAMASALRASLQPQGNFAGIGLFPLLSEVNFNEKSPRYETGAFEVWFKFSCIVQADRYAT